MAEVRFSNVVSPADFIKIVFPTLSAVLTYESSYGPLPSNSFWDVDEKFFAFSPILCSRDYFEWFRKFDDERRIEVADWYRRIFAGE